MNAIYVFAFVLVAVAVAENVTSTSATTENTTSINATTQYVVEDVPQIVTYSFIDDIKCVKRKVLARSLIEKSTKYVATKTLEIDGQAPYIIRMSYATLVEKLMPATLDMLEQEFMSFTNGVGFCKDDLYSNYVISRFLADTPKLRYCDGHLRFDYTEKPCRPLEAHDDLYENILINSNKYLSCVRNNKVLWTKYGPFKKFLVLVPKLRKQIIDVTTFVPCETKFTGSFYKFNENRMCADPQTMYFALKGKFSMGLLRYDFVDSKFTTTKEMTLRQFMAAEIRAAPQLYTTPESIANIATVPVNGGYVCGTTFDLSKITQKLVLRSTETIDECLYQKKALEEVLGWENFWFVVMILSLATMVIMAALFRFAIWIKRRKPSKVTVRYEKF